MLSNFSINLKEHNFARAKGQKNRLHLNFSSDFTNVNSGAWGIPPLLAT